MSPDPTSVPQALPASSGYPSAQMYCLQVLARLLLEYNMRSELLKRKLERTARALGVEVLVFVAYRGVTLFGPEGRQFHAQAKELRINVALSTQANTVVDALAEGRCTVTEAIATLESLETSTPRHNRWLVALIFGLAAAALARLARADMGAVVISGLTSALGLLARQALIQRHALLAALPFSAALLGAVLGGIAIRLGLTTTPGFCLLVPALMLVPGPHLINGLYDVIENHMQTGVSRFALAALILGASALGIFLGGWLTLGMTTVAAIPAPGISVTLGEDMLLAGIAACGFGTFYNTPWRVLWVSILCGMIGHGIRYVCLQKGLNLEIAVLLACVAIGFGATYAVERLKVPFAAVAFAGAVPMMPGALIFGGIGGAMQIALLGKAAPVTVLAETLANLFKAGFVIGAMGMGLLVGAGIATALHRNS